MKIYKLKWLIYFFIYRLNRWLGGKTKWEHRDSQATSNKPWEYCMFRNGITIVKGQLGVRLYNALLSMVVDGSFGAIVPDWIPDDEVEDYLKFREQFEKDFDKRWHGIHKRFN